MKTKATTITYGATHKQQWTLELLPDGPLRLTDPSNTYVDVPPGRPLGRILADLLLQLGWRVARPPTRITE